MEKKKPLKRKPDDFETFENPAEDISDVKDSLDKWVAPEMLRRIGESSYNNIDNSIISE